MPRTEVEKIITEAFTQMEIDGMKYVFRLYEDELRPCPLADLYLKQIMELGISFDDAIDWGLS